MKKRTKVALFITPIILILFISAVGFYIANDTKTKIKELFRMNKKLQEEGFYMAEFEFKLLGLGYLIDKGKFFTALSRLDALHTQYKNRQGLIKMPVFESEEDELEFYLNLQNPRTGAFMDDTFLLNTYHGPTENVIQHLQVLARKTNQPLKLKYRLKYLDNINTIEKLIPVLEDWSYLSLIGSKFPQTSFHNVRDLMSLARDEAHYGDAGVELLIQRHNLYEFSDEWRRALLEWMYNFQDSETGLWGPKSKSGKLLKKDLSNTSSILKAFVDKEGNNIHKEFPLRYRTELFESVLTELEAMPLPQANELDLWHEWGLKTTKGLRIFPRYLWEGGTQSQKKRAVERFEHFLKVRFEKNYIPEKGMFSYYPGGEQATLDGIDGFGIYTEIGAYSPQKQKRLFGSPQENIKDLGIKKLSKIDREDFDIFAREPNCNSIRFYLKNPDYEKLITSAVAVSYPKEKIILDIVDLSFNIKKWMKTTDLTMGNWVSKQEVQQTLDQVELNSQLQLFDQIPITFANSLLQTGKELVVIGFDTMQVPRLKITFSL